MKEVKKNVSSDELCTYIVQGMQEKKAHNIVIIDLKSIANAIADFFVICSGNSDTQIDSIARSIEETVNKACDDKPWSLEGRTNKEWILLDYASVVAHVFKHDRRSYYSLEELWGDAKIIQIEDQ